MERLDNMARPVSVQVRSLVLGQVSSRELWANLEEQAQKNKVFLLLIDSEGDIVRQISPLPTQNQQLIEVPSSGLL